MRISILTADSDVTESRIIAKKITNLPSLIIPVSPTGTAPATHWFCSMEVDDESYKLIQSLRVHSIIEISAPKEFLKGKGLQVIK